MKKTYFKYFCSVLLLMAMVSCQVIPETDRYIPMGEKLHMSRALLIEFTGFKCMNCPNAAVEAHNLLEQYGDSLVVVAIHPSQNGFCKTSNPLYDFSCAGGDSLYSIFGGASATPFPTGVINMQGGFTDYTSWSATIESALCQPQMVYIQLDDAHGNDRQIGVTYTLISHVPYADLRLLFMVVQDNIIGPQRMPDGSDNEEYVHNHMLRKVIVINDVQETGHASWRVPETINDRPVEYANCSVVMAAQDAHTGRVYDVVKLPSLAEQNAKH